MLRELFWSMSRLSPLVCLFLFLCWGCVPAPAQWQPPAAGFDEYPLSLVRVGIRLPRVEDANTDRLLHDPRTIYYKLPQAYQAHFVLAGKHVWGAFASEFLADFNANLDFPWETTLGLNAAHKRKDNPYGTLNFLALPPGSPILVIATDFPVRWLYPDGTVAGEIIYVAHRGRKWVQEIRMRTKEEGSLRWVPSIYRPVADRAEFVRLTGRSSPPAKKHIFLRNPEEDQVQLLQGMVERLPNLDEWQVEQLLARPFQNVTRRRWSAISSAPAADQDFHIVPKDYSLGALKLATALACMECHRQTGISIANLIPKEPTIIRNPGKHGRIRGSDGIFTWHPFAARSIRSSDREKPRSITWRDYDVRLGIVREFTRDMIGDDGVVRVGGTAYRLTKAVEDSLTGTELPNDPVFLHERRKSLKENP